jgi:energy-coupling factor transporter ATP-binding protein EcfA2
MLKSLHIENLTVFTKADLTFGKNLNVFIGENGSGKSHILKAAYAPIALSAESPADGGGDFYFSKGALQSNLAQKLQSVFRPDGLWRLVHRKIGRSKCRLAYEFDQSNLNLKFTFSTVAKTEVTIETAPTARVGKRPIFLPTRELLSIYPGFVSLYETTHLSFDETWRDTCVLLGAPLARGPREARIKELLIPLEAAMGGTIDLDPSGRFYLDLKSGNMEMHLVAEGLRKLGTFARLIATGSLLDKGYLFWDEPEANLNPKIVKTIARTILQIAQSGIQVFIATHSLFLMRELHILQQQDFKSLDSRCFGLHIGTDGAVSVEQGKTMDDIGDISSLDEELAQSDRYLESEEKIAVEPKQK